MDVANSVNPAPYNSEIWIIWYLGRVVTRLEVLLCTSKRASSVKQAGLRHVFRKASKSYSYNKTNEMH